MDERVTICMPAYNAAKYLKSTLKSICRQSYTEWDLVIVDDGSTDNTAEICRKFSNRDERIHLIRQKNMGAPVARKTAVNSEFAKKNEWLMFCDADDLLPENAIEILMKAAELHGADMVVGASRKVIKGYCLKGKNIRCLQISEPRKYLHEEIIRDYLCSFFGMQYFPVSLWAKLYKYDFISSASQHDDVVHFMGDDLVVTLLTTAEVGNMVLIPDVVYYYRMGGGTSKYQPYLLDDFISLYRFRKPLISKYKMKQNAQFYLDVELMYYTQTYLKQQVLKNGVKCLHEEVTKLKTIPEISEVACKLENNENKISGYASMLVNNDINQIQELINAIIKKSRKRDLIKKILT